MLYNNYMGLTDHIENHQEPREFDNTLYNIEIFKEIRKGDISFRWSSCNQEFEFVKWVANKYKFRPIDLDEYCYVIAFLELDNRYEPNIRSVGERIFGLTEEDYKNFSRIGSEIWDRYKELRKEELKLYLWSIREKIQEEKLRKLGEDLKDEGLCKEDKENT